MSQVYMTAKLNLADGTILYPQVSLDNIVASISDPTLVTVATTTNGKVPVTELPVVTVVGDTGSNNNIPTEAAVRALADTKQNTLVAGTGTEIINGSTINAMAVNLNDVVVNNVPNNGLSLEVEGNTMSVVGELAANNSAGVIAGATNGVQLVDGIAQFDNATVDAATPVEIDTDNVEKVVLADDLRTALNLTKVDVDFTRDVSVTGYYDMSAVKFTTTECFAEGRKTGTNTSSGLYLSMANIPEVVSNPGTYLMLIDVTNPTTASTGITMLFNGGVWGAVSGYPSSTTVKNTKTTLALYFTTGPGVAALSSAQLYLYGLGSLAENTRVSFKAENLRIINVTGIPSSRYAEVIESTGAFIKAGPGLMLNGSIMEAKAATVGQTLEGLSGNNEIRSAVVNPGNLRSALSLGQAVDVSCAPANWAYNFDVSTDGGTTWKSISAANLADFINGFSIRYVNNTNSRVACWIGFNHGTFPKKAPGLTYLLMLDVFNAGVAFATGVCSLNSSTSGGVSPIPGVPYQSDYLPNGSATEEEDKVYTRIASIFSEAGNIYLWFPAEANGTTRLDIKNWRQYEVTNCTKDAIRYIAQYGQAPANSPIGPDPLFRDESVFNVRNRYLIKQDMVCPFIPTINMPDNSDLTVAAGLSYKIKYTNDNPHTITADTIPADGYGWDTHIQMFIKGTSAINFQKPLVLMDTLTPNAGHNMSVKWRNGDALVYVDDTNAGYIVTVASGTETGSLYDGITNDYTDYVIFATGLDGTTVDAGNAAFSGGTGFNTVNVLGNGPEKTIITGIIGADSRQAQTGTDNTLNLQDVTLTGTTISGATFQVVVNNSTTTYYGYVNLNNVTMVDSVISDAITAKSQGVYIPAGSTVSAYSSVYAPAKFTGEDRTAVLNVYKKLGYSDAVLKSLTVYPYITGDVCVYAQSTGDLTVEDCTIMPHESPYYGGNIYEGYAASVHVKNSLITGGTAAYGGGCIGSFNQLGYPGYISVVGSTVTGGKADYGAGIQYYFASGEIVDTLVTGNTPSAGRPDVSVFIGTVSIAGCTINGSVGCDAHDTPRSGYVDKVIFSGTNILTGIVSRRQPRHIFDVTYTADSVFDMTGNANTTVVTAEAVHIGDNCKFITTTGSTATVDGMEVTVIGNDASFVGHNGDTQAHTDKDVWVADKAIFVDSLLVDAETAQFTNTTFKDAGRTMDASRILLPKSSTNSVRGSTVATGRHVIMAGLIVVGSNPATPDGSATIEYGTSSSVSISGIGTYIDADGSNDFASTSKIVTVNNSSDLTAVFAATSGSDGTNKYIRVANGSAATVAYTTETVIADKVVFGRDYEPLIAGSLTFTTLAMKDGTSDNPSLTIDESTKTIELTNGKFTVPSSSKMFHLGEGCLLTGGTHASTYVAVRYNYSPMVFGGVILSGGGTIGETRLVGASPVSLSNTKVCGITFDGCRAIREAYVAGTFDTYGGVTISGTGTELHNCVIKNGFATYGGGVMTNGDTLITGCTFSDNVCGYRGADLAVQSNMTTLQDCLFTRSATYDNGQGSIIFREGGTTGINISGSTFCSGAFIANYSASPTVNITGYNKFLATVTGSTINFSNTTVDMMDNKYANPFSGVISFGASVFITQNNGVPSTTTWSTTELHNVTGIGSIGKDGKLTKHADSTYIYLGGSVVGATFVSSSGGYYVNPGTTATFRGDVFDYTFIACPSNSSTVITFAGTNTFGGAVIMGETGANGTIKLNNNTVLNFKNAAIATATPLLNATTLQIGTGCKVVTTSGSTVTLNNGSASSVYHTINQDGTLS